MSQRDMGLKPDVFERLFRLDRLVKQEAESAGKSWFAVYLRSAAHNHPLHGRGSALSAEWISAMAGSVTLLTKEPDSKLARYRHSRSGKVLWPVDAVIPSAWFHRRSHNLRHESTLRDPMRENPPVQQPLPADPGDRGECLRSCS